jgi:hypothetical protein
MPGLWKAWKAKGRLPPLSTSPLGISRRDSHIPTAPATKADGKVGNQKQVFHFPTAPNIYMSKKQTTKLQWAGFRPPPGGGRSAPPKSQEVIVVDREK